MLAAYNVLNNEGPETLSDLRVNLLDMLFSWDNEPATPINTGLQTTDKIALLQQLKNGNIS